MKELTSFEVDDVSGAGMLARTADFLSGVSLGLLVFGPEAAAMGLIAAGTFYVAAAVFEH